MKRTITLLLTILCCFTQHLHAQIEIIGSDAYGRIFDVIYDKAENAKLYARTLGNHLVTSDDNGISWDVFYGFPESSIAIENLKTFQNDKLSFTTKNSTSITTNRTLHIMDIASKEIVQQYIAPSPDPNSDLEWIDSYSLYEDDTDIALISLGYKIGLNSFQKIYYTTDGGNTWDLIYYTVDHLNIFSNNVTISPDNPQKLFVARGQGDSGTIGGVLMSIDGGEIWEVKIPGVTLQPIAFNPNDANDILIGSSIGFGDHDQNLYRSVDGGETWNIVPLDWNDYILDCITYIGFNPSNSDHIVVLEENEVIVSYDGGESWQHSVYPNAYGNVYEYSYGTNLSFNPNNSQELFISANYYPMISTDGGETSVKVNNPYFVGDGNVHYSSNNGEEHLYYGVQFGYVHRDMDTQAESEYDIMPLDYVSNSSGITVHIDPNLTGRVYSFSGGFMGSQLKVSDDHGENSHVILSNFSSHFHIAATSPNNPNVVWGSFSSFGENPELYKINFSDLNNVEATLVALPENDIVTGIHFDPDNPDNVMLMIGTWVYRSDNGGNTWTNSSEGLGLLVPYQDLIIGFSQNPLDEDQFTIGTNRGIFTSLDAGITWQQISDGIVHFVAHSTETNGHIVAATHNSSTSNYKLHYSTSGGTIWEVVEDQALSYLASGNTSSSTAVKFSEESAEVYLASVGLGLVKYTINMESASVPQTDFAENAMVVYPNPASSEINIQLRNEQTISGSIYSITGQKLMEIDQKTKVDVSSLRAGIYLIRIETVAGTSISARFVKI